MVIPTQNVRSRDLKMQILELDVDVNVDIIYPDPSLLGPIPSWCLNWRGPKLDAAYFKVGRDFLPKVAIIGFQKQGVMEVNLDRPQRHFRISVRA
jgi:hypothetical protein